MRQKSIGEVLRAARESRGWNFADLQRMTKIQAKYLQALEYNDFEFIPDKTYTRSFLQRYAEVLELDAAVLLDAYDQNSLVMYYEAGEEVELQSELRRSYKVKKKKTSYLPLIYLLLASTFILCFVTYIVYSRVQNQARITGTSTSYSVVSQSSSTIMEESETSTSTSSSTTPSSSSQVSGVSLVTSGGGSDLAVAVKGAKGPVTVTLAVSNVTSWVSLTDSEIAGGFTLSTENPTVSATLPAGTSTATLVLGVVRGVDITIAGQKLDTSALTNQSGNVILTIEQ
ncbi:helix-turn-helix domain-containing protein [Streptococcus sp. zg-86]|uniref:Helix-turn-helix domain-containing protein n=1 Tax=Streptococcus zhangguiae TaxID=2664091 RepID=A0A6I4R715_9STRE|nr:MULTISPECIES: cytoskeleton protein RodZ [unclassified Streptococcus]MTB63426.1 helix-turn-helix domain-containing protein [Streptococcus sp. zg-86]MTB89925.1 helix-turn-helix domain-containing protein [Streptococcus sp. zg-36]MWV55596.1 helix-turn-helix domain-containing protein [Streptococcus sp. zg-70]QTH47784.1 helix-turn-helix domain-containing protein [Streptococcus sp. zg-86]